MARAAAPPPGLDPIGRRRDRGHVDLCPERPERLVDGVVFGICGHDVTSVVSIGARACRPRARRAFTVFSGAPSIRAISATANPPRW